MRNFPILFPTAAALGAIFFLAACQPRPSEESLEIRVDSEPSGAFLSVNGKEVGRTPHVLQEPTFGKYLLQFSKEGFESVDRVVAISQDSPHDLVVPLQRLMGLVLFQTVPPGAEVTVNGIFKGKSPLLVTDLPTGGYKVAFRLEGYDPREMELTLNDRTPQLCQMNMKSVYATVRVDSKPPGAAVMIDGIHKGQTPCSIDDVLVGNHTLRLVKDGYKEYQDEIKLAQTGVYPVTIQMEECFAALDVVSTPAEARVAVNDEFKGRTPLQVDKLRDGKYTVTIEKPGFEKVVRTVEISKTRDAKLDVTLEKATGVLSLNIAPAGCAVAVDGELKGVSAEGPFALELSPGSYKVEISKARYKPQSFKLDVGVRKTTSRDVALQRIWVKDTVVVLKDGRVIECMLVAKYPNGAIKVESGPGITQEFSAGEIDSIAPFKP